MKKVLGLVIWGLLSINGQGQCVDWEWARYASGNSSSYGEQSVIATDRNGDVFITGSFNGDIYLGGDTLFSGPFSFFNFFIVKYDSSGNFQWVKSQQPTAGVTDIRSVVVATDGDGNIYVGGSFKGDSITLGSYTIYNPSGLEQMLLTKYDSSGNVIWVKNNGGSMYDCVQGITTDGGGNVYVTGYFGGDSIVFGTHVLFNTGQENTFIAKYDSSGNVLWATCAFGSRINTPAHIAADNSGNIVAEGFFQGDSITFGGITLSANNPDTNSNIFIVKYNSAGSLLWAKGVYAGGTNYENNTVTGLAVDMHGNVYATGVFNSDSISFDSIILVDLTPRTDYYDFFIVKYDASGNPIWVKGSNGGNAGGAYIAMDPYDNLYLDWTIYHDSVIIFDTTLFMDSGDVFSTFLFRLDSSGRTICIEGLGTGGGEISIDHNGNGYLGGSFTGNNFVIGNDTLNANYYGNMFVAKFGSPYKQCSLTAPSINIKGDTLSINSTSFQWLLNGSRLPSDTTNQIIATQPGQYTVQITDSNGCTALSNPVTVTGINNVTEDAISIYPNPTSTGWQLAVGVDLIGAEFQIWDNAGQVIYQSKITSTSSNIQLTGAAGGIYFLKINSPEGLLVRKLVKL